MKRNKENKTPSSSKGKKAKSKKKPEPASRPSILDVMRKTSDCDCEVVARAVRSHVHMNLSLPDKRVELGKDKPKTEDKNDKRQAQRNLGLSNNTETIDTGSAQCVCIKK